MTDAIMCVEHYLWHGDPVAGLPALPGRFNDNGYSWHVTAGKQRRPSSDSLPIRRSISEDLGFAAALGGPNDSHRYNGEQTARKRPCNDHKSASDCEFAV